MDEFPSSAATVLYKEWEKIQSKIERLEDDLKVLEDRLENAMSEVETARSQTLAKIDRLSAEQEEYVTLLSSMGIEPS